MSELVLVDPDRPCRHEHFGAVVTVNRICASDEDPTTVGFNADVTVHCTDCTEPFRWTGLQAGLDPRRPMVSVDEATLHAPLRPASADPDFGMGLPGFAVTWEANGKARRAGTAIERLWDENAVLAWADLTDNYVWLDDHERAIANGTVAMVTAYLEAMEATP